MEEGSVSRRTLKTWQGELLLAEVTKKDVSGMKKCEPKQRLRTVICVWEVTFEQGPGLYIKDRIRETGERKIRNSLSITIRSAWRL